MLNLINSPTTYIDSLIIISLFIQNELQRNAYMFARYVGLFSNIMFTKLKKGQVHE